MEVKYREVGNLIRIPQITNITWSLTGYRRTHPSSGPFYIGLAVELEPFDQVAVSRLVFFSLTVSFLQIERFRLTEMLTLRWCFLGH
jgi:hypothetical protein